MDMMRIGTMGAAIAILGVAVGCTTGGLSGTLPAVTNPSEAANITLYRDGTLPGWFTTIVVDLNDREIYRVGRNEAFSFAVDPGQYLLVYRIGFNECRKVVWVEPRENVRVRLSPICSV
ncbi:hypothetical protein CKO25_14295 [Thiocapsa imhoffii]|uniref:Uncharacterized protein n=2 Tax=Thiocapsa imhoffii TaxID=382777 RepID=A0A9X0WKG0_9GAMM|nr:hypothetical protein [Thiocapsa imhoffii]